MLEIDRLKKQNKKLLLCTITYTAYANVRSLGIVDHSLAPI